MLHVPGHTKSLWETENISMALQHTLRPETIISDV